MYLYRYVIHDLLTHDVEVEWCALPISFGVEPDASVVACIIPAHTLQGQTFVADDYSLADVVA